MNEILFVLNNAEGGDGKVHLLVREIDAIWFNVASCGVEVDREGGYERPLDSVLDYFGGAYPIPVEATCKECFGIR